MGWIIFGVIFIIAGFIIGAFIKHECDMKGAVAVGGLVGVVLAIVLVVCGCIASVPTGHTGILTTFGEIESTTLDAGLHFKAPWQKLTKIDTTINEISIVTPAYTNDSQTVDLAITIQYRISTTETFSVIKDNGLTNTQETLEHKLENRITTAAKNIIAKKKADDLLTNRSGVVTELAAEIDVFNDEYYVIISAVNLTNLDFTDEYEAAVAAKVAQQQAYEKALIEQQQALAAAENEKKIKTTEAEAAAEVARIQAQADLEVTKIQADAAEYAGQKEAAKNKAISESLTAELIKYYYIQQWNGELPDTVLSDSSGIILDINK